MTLLSFLFDRSFHIAERLRACVLRSAYIGETLNRALARLAGTNSALSGNI